jgi:serine/threonine-protein kinase
MADLQAGATVGAYRIVDVLGRGGMGVVYRAYQPALDRHVALKVLPEALAADEMFVRRFQSEVRVAARLEHPNIVPIYEVGEANGAPFIAMRLIAGSTLADYAEERGPLSLATTTHLLSQVADALDFAHEHGIVHRDVKPQNILVDARSRVYLTDFGIAHMVGTLTRLTQTGATVGTPAYMSPEQAQSKPIGPGTDRYALGIIAYELLAGTLPFHAESSFAWMFAHVNEPPPPLRTHRPDLSGYTDEALQRMLEKQPERRWPSCMDFVRALGGVATPTLLHAADAPVAPPRAEAGDDTLAVPFGVAAPPPETMAKPPGAAAAPAEFAAPPAGRASTGEPAPRQTAPEPSPELVTPERTPGGADPPPGVPLPPQWEREGEGTSEPAPQMVTMPSPAARTARRPWLPAGIVAIALVLLATVIVSVTQLGRPREPAPPPQAGVRGGAPIAATGAPATSGPAHAAAALVPTGAPPTAVAANPVLERAVAGVFERLPNGSSAVFQNLTGPERVEHDAVVQVPAASTIKLAVMIEVMRQEYETLIAWDQQYTITRNMVVGGTGVLQNQVGRTLTTRELLETAIVESDNVAGNQLVRLVGIPNVNETMRALGFAETRLGRPFMDLEAQRRGLDNQSSARDAAGMLQRMYEGRLVSPAASEEMLRLLRLRGERTEPNLDYIGRRLAPRPTIAHVNGTFTGVRNEVALIEQDGRAYVLTLFLRGQGNEQAAEAAIARASEQIRNAVMRGT